MLMESKKFDRRRACRYHEEVWITYVALSRKPVNQCAILAPQKQPVDKVEC